jgi:hypothetical protein
MKTYPKILALLSCMAGLLSAATIDEGAEIRFTAWE